MKQIVKARILEMLAKRPVVDPPAAARAPGVPQEKPRGRKKIVGPKYLTEAEVPAFFSAVAAGGSARDLAIFELVYHRGLRATEVGRISVDQLRRDFKRVTFDRLKGSSGGEYILTDREQKALKAWIRERGWDPGPLFPSRHRRGISRRRLDELMKKYAAAANIAPERRHMHAWKHTCGVTLARIGVGVEEAQDLMGHANIKNTMIYYKITNRRRQAVGERLSRLW